MKNLRELLLQLQNENSDFEDIFLYFQSYINALLTKYKIDLYSNDLLLHLWNISLNLNLSIFNSDLEIKKFIFTSLKRHCVNLYHKNIRDTKVAYNSSVVTIELDKSSNSNLLDDSNLIFNDLIVKLSPKQKDIISLRYNHCLSDYEISKHLNISRQAVHKNREKALKSLRSDLIN